VRDQAATTVARSIRRSTPQHARLWPLFGLAAALGLGGLASCLSYDPDAEQAELAGAGGSGWDDGELEELSGEAGGASGAADGSPVGAVRPAPGWPPAETIDLEESGLEVRSGSLRADPSPDPWR
jgi:hypothetical protein